MTEQQQDGGDSRPQQGADARAAVDGAQDGAAEVRGEGERMARKLVQDVAAYEVDPPPPSRVADGSEQSGEASPTP